jgi:4-amino-4-deoxy-L-arabinose transferase-like glycosyltransferase
MTCAIICRVTEQSQGATFLRTRHSVVVGAGLVAAVLLGALMRFYRLGSLPPGLYHDEALNGLDALRVLGGEHPIFFEANNGREPLFVYAMALALSIWGRTPFAVRLMAAVLGTLTIPATYLMARALFNDRVGLWSAWLIAVAPWPINLSRIGLRAVSMPLIVALALWLWWIAEKQEGWRRTLCLVLGGLLFGLSLYTYTSARFVPVAIAAYALFQVWLGRGQHHLRGLAYVAFPALVAMTPLILYALKHWDVFVERPAQVSVFSPAIHHGDLVGTLADNVLRAAGLFTFLGDDIPRHNVPLRPLFDPIVSAFFLMGAFSSVLGARRGGARALALIWTIVMLLPTILAEDCPHFLRAVGVLPMAAVFPALGLEQSYGWLQERSPGCVGSALVSLVLGVSTVWGGYDYFVRHGSNPELGFYFEADQVRGAVEINRFLGSGWQGEGLSEPMGEPLPGRQVYLGPRIWEDRFALNFLVASPERVAILGREPVVEADAVLALEWPHTDMRHVQKVFPSPAVIQVWPGPLERGDLDPQPSLLYVAYYATRLQGEVGPRARFDDGVELLGWEAHQAGEGRTRVRLNWRTTRPLSTDYTAFVHLVRSGQVVAQADGVPAQGFYPTTWWRPGDELVDDCLLDATYDPDQDQLVVGWYELGSMRHLRVLGQEGQLGQDRLVLR